MRMSKALEQKLGYQAREAPSTITAGRVSLLQQEAIGGWELQREQYYEENKEAFEKAFQAGRWGAIQAMGNRSDP